MKTKQTPRKRPIKAKISKTRVPPAKSRKNAVLAETLHIKSILVPIDFSEPSKKALSYAAALARQFGASLTLLHVIEPVAAPDIFRSFPLVEDDSKLKKTVLGQLEMLLSQQGIPAKLVEKVLVNYGRSFNEIAIVAGLNKSDLIVIATHGYTGIKHALLGSTTERVVRHASCPVLVVREQEREIVLKTKA